LFKKQGGISKASKFLQPVSDSQYSTGCSRLAAGDSTKNLIYLQCKINCFEYFGFKNH
jgi:hypothetical protein